MQQEADVSIDVVRIIQSMVLLFVAADAIVRFVFRMKSAGRAGTRRTAATGWSGDVSNDDRRVPLPGRLVSSDLNRGTGR